MMSVFFLTGCRVRRDQRLHRAFMTDGVDYS